jgi:hypothetical protein
MRTVEIGDIVATDHGFKMVVDVYRADNPKEICLSCVDADDNAELGDVWMTPRTYFRSSVVPVFDL